jgi:hypothetical protein
VCQKRKHNMKEKIVKQDIGLLFVHETGYSGRAVFVHSNTEILGFISIRGVCVCVCVCVCARARAFVLCLCCPVCRIKKVKKNIAKSQKWAVEPLVMMIL